MCPNSVDMPVATTTRLAATMGHQRARVGHVAPVAQRKPSVLEARGGLLDRRGLAGERGLVDREIDRLDQSSVGGDPVAGAEEHDIAWHELPRRDDGFVAVAQHTGRRGGHAPQGLDRPFRAVLLDEAEQHGEQHDDRDDHGFESVAEQSRDERRAEQDQDQHVLELSRERVPGGRACRGVQLVRPVHGGGVVRPQGSRVRSRTCAASPSPRPRTGCASPPQVAIQALQSRSFRVLRSGAEVAITAGLLDGRSRSRPSDPLASRAAASCSNSRSCASTPCTRRRSIAPQTRTIRTAHAATGPAMSPTNRHAPIRALLTLRPSTVRDDSSHRQIDTQNVIVSFWLCVTREARDGLAELPPPALLLDSGARGWRSRRAADKLRLSQPTISAQVKMLEEALGERLFQRKGRTLVLTDVGRVVDRYADEIFTAGHELLETLKGRPSGRAPQLAVGVANAVPKLVVYRLLLPATEGTEAIQITCREGHPDQLIAQLATHTLDVVISDTPAPPHVRVKVFNHLLGESGTTFFAGVPLARRLRRRFPRSLNGAAMLLPTVNTALRRALDQWFEAEGLRPTVAGEFEDSALLQAFGEAGRAVFPAPTAIERDVCRHYRVGDRRPDVRGPGAVLRDFRGAPTQAPGGRGHYERGSDGGVRLTGHRVVRFCASVCRRAWPGRRTPRRLPSPSRTASDAGGSSASGPTAVAPISIASTPSAISSPAPEPTMPTPRMRSVSGSISSLVMPSTRSMAMARPDAGHGNLRDLDLEALLLGLGFGQARPRDFGIGEHHRRNRRRLEHRLVPGDRLDRHARFVRRLVRQHRLAGHVADREDRRLGGAALPVGLDEALGVDLDLASCRGRRSSRSAGGRSRPARSRRSASFGAPSPSKVTVTPLVRRPSSTVTLVESITLSKVFSTRCARSCTRSRSAPGSRPGVISTTDTLVPSAA